MAKRLDYHGLKPDACYECGAKNLKEAETMCICNGDKDHCHGCDLWDEPDAAQEEAGQARLDLKQWEKIKDKCSFDNGELIQTSIVDDYIKGEE